MNDDVNLDIAIDNPEVEDGQSTENVDEEANKIVPVGTTSKDTSSAAVFKGKNDHECIAKPMQRIGGADPRKGTIYVPKSRGAAISLEDPVKLKTLLFMDDMIRRIVTHANQEIELRKQKRKNFFKIT